MKPTGVISCHLSFTLGSHTPVLLCLDASDRFTSSSQLPHYSVVVLLKGRTEVEKDEVNLPNIAQINAGGDTEAIP